MNSFVFAFVATLAVAAASNIAVLPSARILQGPSTRTTVLGPDGSAISAVAPGGRIISEQSLGVVAQTIPAIAPAIAPAVVAARSPLIAPGLIGARLGLGADTIVAGPSGTIAASRGLGLGLAAAPLAATWW